MGSEKAHNKAQDSQFDRATLVDDGGIKADKTPGPTAEQTRLLANPLSGLSRDEIVSRAEAFAHEHDLHDIKDELLKGALVAAYPNRFETMSELNEEDKAALRMETEHPYRQTKTLYALVICCSMAAVVQGQDQSLINGANIFYPEQFGIGSTSERDSWLVGLVNAAPYFGCLFFACWLTDPLNHYLGRKGTILVTLVFACVCCIWSALANSWINLFVARLILSIGIGPKSSTVPVYAAETAPPAIRGSLVMQWQMWTAFGIMLGYVCNLIFYNVSSSSIEGLNWRLMLGSGCVPPIIVFLQVLYLPESPRWLLQKGKVRKAYQSLLRLRNTPLEAARDLFAISQALKVEESMHRGNRYLELFTVPRNRRATIGACLVMFMQQFCGINVIAYYSSSILVENGFGQFEALLGSWGFGMKTRVSTADSCFPSAGFVATPSDWLFALPAIKTIDRYGRRSLLLVGFPLMAFWLAFTGSVFFLPEGQGRLAAILIGIYFFAISYSPSEGPVPFTYSAEAFPLYVRPIGMSLATATCWGFNGILAITWPSLSAAFTPSGAFYYYAAWNIVGWFAVLLFLPETAKLSLEELDAAFNVPTRTHAAWGLRQPKYWWKRYVLRQKHVQFEPVFELDPSVEKTFVETAGGH